MSGLSDLIIEALEDMAKAGVTVCSAMLVIRIVGQFLWGW